MPLVSAGGVRACPERQRISLELKSYGIHGLWVFTSLWLQLLFTSTCNASRTVPTKNPFVHLLPILTVSSLCGPASDDQNTGY